MYFILYFNNMLYLLCSKNVKFNLFSFVQFFFLFIKNNFFNIFKHLYSEYTFLIRVIQWIIPNVDTG
jgi:hypothetical protein